MKKNIAFICAANLCSSQIAEDWESPEEMTVRYREQKQNTADCHMRPTLMVDYMD